MNPISLKEVCNEPDLLTPALMYDEAKLVTNVTRIRSYFRGQSVILLYAMKAFTVPTALKTIVPVLDGFHASSLLEARLSRSLLGEKNIFISPVRDCR